MSKKKEELLDAYENLLRLKNSCEGEVSKECAVSNLTVKQIEYLKIIDRHKRVTFSMLATITKNAKPTITEMINKFLSQKCVYKERCPDDARVSYIHLTENAKRIARHEKMILQRVVDRMMKSLTREEIDTLISILKKVR